MPCGLIFQRSDEGRRSYLDIKVKVRLASLFDITSLLQLDSGCLLPSTYPNRSTHELVLLIQLIHVVFPTSTQSLSDHYISVGVERLYHVGSLTFTSRFSSFIHSFPCSRPAHMRGATLMTCFGTKLNKAGLEGNFSLSFNNQRKTPSSNRLLGKRACATL
jgi:hypothetical protein